MFQRADKKALRGMQCNIQCTNCVNPNVKVLTITMNARFGSSDRADALHGISPFITALGKKVCLTRCGSREAS